MPASSGTPPSRAELLAAYRGPKPQHENEMSGEELSQAADWIRQRSQHLRAECREAGLPYVDVCELGFESAVRETRRHLLAPPDRSIDPARPSHSTSLSDDHPPARRDAIT